MQAKFNNHIIQGFLLAIAATLLWSGNFIIARKVNTAISPISLAFYRWACASIILFPFVYQKVLTEWTYIKLNWKILSLIAFTGIALFNTFVYVAGYNTTAINMALIGTTSSPIFATIMAVIFLKERLSFYRIFGMVLCILGVILLISKGSWEVLQSFKFSSGDAWILAGAFAFAVYNILVRKKPAKLSALSFLLVLFVLGTIMIFPFFLAEQFIIQKSTDWSYSLGGSILYLGIGTSVLAFWCWNLAIGKLGAGRTVLFGNLIPIFSTLEAVLILDETITPIHFYSGILVFAGLVIANFTIKNK